MDLAMLFEPLFLFKIITLLVIAVYAAFAFIMLNQVRTMNKIVSYTPVTTLLLLLATIHLFAALSLFAFALVIL